MHVHAAHAQGGVRGTTGRVVGNALLRGDPDDASRRALASRPPDPATAPNGSSVGRRVDWWSCIYIVEACLVVLSAHQNVETMLVALNCMF